MGANLLKEEMGLEEIKKYIPHRKPWLLLDEVVEIYANSIIAVKTFTAEECEGHFGTVPGVLICEALAQAGAVLINYLYCVLGGKKLPLLRRITIDNARFLSVVHPGEQVTLKVEIINSRNGVYSLKGTAEISGKKVVEWNAIGAAVAVVEEVL